MFTENESYRSGCLKRNDGMNKMPQFGVTGLKHKLELNVIVSRLMVTFSPETTFSGAIAAVRSSSN